MALTDLDSDDKLQKFIADNAKALVTYSATWCGPCQAAKPDLERMANQYANDMTKDVKFGIVFEHNLGVAIHNYNDGEPFQPLFFFVNKMEIGRVEGANLTAVRDLAEKLGPSIWSWAKSLADEGLPPLQKRKQELIAWR
jgi:thiol-disulfide isomerase/thioredoxin